MASLALATTWVTTAEAEPASEERYLLHCSGCHGPRGHGTPGVTPTLHGLSRLLDVRGGRAYVVAVPGVAQAPVDDAALAALLNWVLVEFSDAAPAVPYTAEEIGALRDEPLRDPAAARREIMHGT
jgi:mono/diheme cytochrome c family protein